MIRELIMKKQHDCFMVASLYVKEWVVIKYLWYSNSIRNIIIVKKTQLPVMMGW